MDTQLDARLVQPTTTQVDTKEESKQSPDDGSDKSLKLVELQDDPKVTPTTAQVETTKTRKRNKPCGEGSNQPPPKLPRTRSKTGRAWN